MAFDEVRQNRPEIELRLPNWFEHLRIAEVPPGLLGGADQSRFHLLVARVDGENVATAMAFDLDAIAGSTTSGPWSVPGGVVWARR
jgi:hypothetical protein